MENKENHTLYIIKECMPYLDYKTRKLMNTIVKSSEFISCFSNRNEPSLSICEAEQNISDIEGMLLHIKEICKEQEKEILDILINFFKAQKLYNTYKLKAEAEETNYFENENYKTTLDSILHSNNIMDIIKLILTPEQRNTFDIINMMMSNQNL